MIQPAMRSRLSLLALAFSVTAWPAVGCKSRPPAAEDEPTPEARDEVEPGGAEAATKDAAPVPVAELAEELVEHIVADDVPAAMKLLITREEFARPEIWGALATNEVARRMPVDISYANTRGDSEEVVVHAAGVWAGQELTYLRTELPAPEPRGERFDLYRGPVIIVRHADDETPLRLLGSLLHDKEQEQWYAVHFDDKAPRRPAGAPAPTGAAPTPPAAAGGG